MKDKLVESMEEGSSSEPPPGSGDDGNHGDTEEEVITWVEFTENTTFHGIKYIFDNKPFGFRRALWFLCVLLAVGVFGYAGIVRLLDYRKHTATVNMKVTLPETLNFPAVTICNQNSQRLTKAVDYELYDYIDAYFSNDPHLERFGNLNHINTTEFVYDAAHRMEDFVDKCIWKKKDCRDQFRRVLTDAGICYTFTPEDRTVTSPGSRFGLRLVLNVEQYEYMKNDQDDVGVKVLLHATSERPQIRDQGFVVEPGKHTLVAIKKIQFSGLGKPFDTTSTTAEPLSNCQLDCESAKEKKKCNCTNVYMPKNGTDPPTCGLRKQFECILAADNNSTICPCLAPSKRDSFEPRLSTALLSIYNMDQVAFSQPNSRNIKTMKYIRARDTSQRAIATVRNKNIELIDTLWKHTKQLESDLRTYSEILNNASTLTTSVGTLNIFAKSIREEFTNTRVVTDKMFQERKIHFESLPNAPNLGDLYNMIDDMLRMFIDFPVLDTLEKCVNEENIFPDQLLSRPDEENGESRRYLCPPPTAAPPPRKGEGPPKEGPHDHQHRGPHSQSDGHHMTGDKDQQHYGPNQQPANEKSIRKKREIQRSILKRQDLSSTFSSSSNLDSSLFSSPYPTPSSLYHFSSSSSPSDSYNYWYSSNSSPSDYFDSYSDSYHSSFFDSSVSVNAYDYPTFSNYYYSDYSGDSQSPSDYSSYNSYDPSPSDYSSYNSYDPSSSDYSSYNSYDPSLSDYSSYNSYYPSPSESYGSFMAGSGYESSSGMFNTINSSNSFTTDYSSSFTSSDLGYSFTTPNYSSLTSLSYPSATDGTTHGTTQTEAIITTPDTSDFTSTTSDYYPDFSNSWHSSDSQSGWSSIVYSGDYSNSNYYSDGSAISYSPSDMYDSSHSSNSLTTDYSEPYTSSDLGYSFTTPDYSGFTNPSYSSATDGTTHETTETETTTMTTITPEFITSDYYYDHSDYSSDGGSGSYSEGVCSTEDCKSGASSTCITAPGEIPALDEITMAAIEPACITVFTSYSSYTLAQQTTSSLFYYNVNSMMNGDDGRYPDYSSYNPDDRHPMYPQFPKPDENNDWMNDNSSLEYAPTKPPVTFPPAISGECARVKYLICDSEKPRGPPVGRNVTQALSGFRKKYMEEIVAIFSDKPELFSDKQVHKDCLVQLDKLDRLTPDMAIVYDKITNMKKAKTVQEFMEALEPITNSSTEIRGVLDEARTLDMERCMWFKKYWTPKNGKSKAEADVELYVQQAQQANVFLQSLPNEITQLGTSLKAIKSTLDERIISYFDQLMRFKNGTFEKSVLTEKYDTFQVKVDLTKMRNNLDDFIARARNWKQSLGNVKSHLTIWYRYILTSMLVPLVTHKTVKELPIVKASRGIPNLKPTLDSVMKDPTKAYEIPVQVISPLKDVPLTFSQNLSDVLSALITAEENVRDNLDSYSKGNKMEDAFFMENFLQLDLYYPELSCQSIEYQEAFTFVSLLSEIGGFMGLLLGASVLTVCEVADFIFLQCVNACGPKKAKKKKK